MVEKDQLPCNNCGGEKQKKKSCWKLLGCPTKGGEGRNSTGRCSGRSLAYQSELVGDTSQENSYVETGGLTQEDLQTMQRLMSNFSFLVPVAVLNLFLPRISPLQVLPTMFFKPI